MKFFKQVDHQDISELRKELAELAPLGEKLRAEKATIVLAQRQEAKGKLEALEQERDATVPKLQEAIAERQAAYNTVKAALDKSINELRAATSELSGQAHRFQSGIDRHREALLETADPAIDAAVTWFKDKLDELRKPGVIQHVGRLSKSDVFSWTKKTERETNRNAVLSALKFCQSTISALEAMKLEPGFDADAVQKLKDAIPKTDAFETIKGEANLPKPNATRHAIEERERENDAFMRRLGLTPAT